MTLSEQKRQQIIDAAINEFLASGFSNTSMDRVAACASVSKRTVYNHFASKEALFVGVIEQMLEMIETTVQIEYHREQTIEEQLRRIAEQSVALFGNPMFMSLAKLVIRESIGEPERMKIAKERFDKIEHSLARWFQRAMDDGKILRQEPWLIEGIFAGVLRSFCFFPQVLRNQPLPSEEEVAKIIDASVEMIVSTYGC